MVHLHTHIQYNIQFSQFSHSVMSDSLQPHELQHARPPCLSPTPGVTQTHVHHVGDAIQPSHPQESSPTPQFKSINSSAQVYNTNRNNMGPQTFLSLQQIRLKVQKPNSLWSAFYLIVIF